MTRDEAFNRVDELALDADLPIDRHLIGDAKRLVEFLPDAAVQELSRESIRPEPMERRQIEFFWSQSTDLMSPGNRITRLETLGSGQFAVLTGIPDSIEWQCSPDGRVMPNILALDADGAQALLEQIIEWQVSGR